MIDNQYAHQSIPGLFVIPDYFSAEQCHLMLADTLSLYNRLEGTAKESGLEEIACIPQPDFVRSAQHNLHSNESFVRVVLNEREDREIYCEYFPRYGEDGHALGYFRKNSNLPDFVLQTVLNSLQQTMQTLLLVRDNQQKSWQWKLTVNFYKNVNGTVAGFPFHVDIPANGVVTMILNIHSEAFIQMAKDDKVIDIIVPIGGLVVLSGESRYDWKHRVVPKISKQMLSDQPANKYKIERVSMVLGFQ
ncbi:hypothetical protein MNBD_GAMMA12-2173 [hydrothermal vent metagenome]|uniref:Fe2OG dioxygenase domain-containing protein n=1 Tax=hydrothermal vent metagenome TaxID=652676 RepID=A0A3B0Z3B3_9ZZZZ